jgi:hypothetical protein
MQPENPKKKSYEELVEIIKNHHVPKPPVIVQRYKFNTGAILGLDKQTSQYIRLRPIFKHCQRCLLAEPTLDFNL